MSLPFLDAAAVARLGYRGAVDALRAALRDGLDVDADPPRSVLPVGTGELLVMPSRAGVVKLVSVGGDPRIQGVAVVFDPGTLAPVAVVDGVALTTLRTAAVSALAVDLLAPARACRVVVLGRGPQAHAHAAAVAAVRAVADVVLLGRGEDPSAAVAAADVVCCCTTARTPLFDGALVRDDALVVAIGSHEPDARETDDALAARATMVVESRAAAVREAGDVIGAVAAGALDPASLVELGDLVRGTAQTGPGPRLFKSTGMAWEDAVVARAVLGAH